jgi:predicted N-acetyltransferase YhbS
MATAMRFVLAEGALLERVLDSTYPVWHDGLSRRAYSQWSAAQLRTAWGRERLTRVALLDGSGRLLASAKRYRYDVRIDGRDGWMCGIGAVLTPPEHRRRGHAARLVEHIVNEAQHEGALVAGLFSEIGEAYYSRLGFARVPMDEVTVNVILQGGAPAMLVRSGTDRDYKAICAMHATRAAAARFALRRDPQALHYAISKKRLFAGLSPPETRALEFFVAEEGATAVAYVVLSRNQHGWTLEEAGDRDPAGARLGGMLQVLGAREPSQEPRLIRAWWPPSFAVPPQLSLTRRTDPKDIFMLRWLDGVPPDLRAADVFYWRSDFF